VHHLPAGPPLSARLRGATTRWLFLLRRPLRRRSGRLALGALVGAAMIAIVLSMSVVSGSSEQAPSVSLDASASSSASSGTSPVVMGRDGKPITSAVFAGVRSEASYSAAPEVEAAGSPSTSREAAGSPSTSRETTAGSTPVSGTGRTTAAGTRGSGASGTTGSTGTGKPVTGTPSTTAGSPTTSSGSTADPTTDAAQSSESDAVPVVTDPAPQSVQEQVLALLDAARADHGCTALVPDGALTSAAQVHSADMRDAGVLGPLTPAGGSLLDLGGRAAAVAHGPADPAAVVQGWLADPGDAAALLDCGVGSGGVGVADGNDGSWWTLLLG
jgi:uncharacterized protein YkwD